MSVFGVGEKDAFDLACISISARSSLRIFIFSIPACLCMPLLDLLSIPLLHGLPSRISFGFDLSSRVVGSLYFSFALGRIGHACEFWRFILVRDWRVSGMGLKRCLGFFSVLFFVLSVFSQTEPKVYLCIPHTTRHHRHYHRITYNGIYESRPPLDDKIVGSVFVEKKKKSVFFCLALCIGDFG